MDYDTGQKKGSDKGNHACSLHVQANQILAEHVLCLFSLSETIPYPLLSLSLSIELHHTHRVRSNELQLDEPCTAPQAAYQNQPFFLRFIFWQSSTL
jgi:hypothetical protein